MKSRTIYEKRFFQFLLEKLDEQCLFRGLRLLAVEPMFHMMFMMMFKHDFQLSRATTAYMDATGANPFAMPKILHDFLQIKDETMTSLLAFAETSPKVRGDQHEWNVDGYHYVHYESYVLDDLQHLVVLAKMNGIHFASNWQMMPTALCREAFNKVHVYQWSDGEWVISYDDYAEQYREAYAKMQDLMA